MDYGAELLGYLEDKAKLCDWTRMNGGKALYGSYEDLVVAHGTLYTDVATRLPKGMRWGGQQKCFRNAYERAAHHGYLYVEGFAASIGCCFAAHHAWLVDGNGTVIDPTPNWRGVGAAYMGIAFNLEYVREVIVARGIYGVLDNYQQNHPLLKRSGEIERAKVERGLSASQCPLLGSSFALAPLG